MSGEHVTFIGKVVECQRDKFKVQSLDGNIIIAQISGKLRKNKIQILLGDNVTVKMSPYDLTNGIIVLRSSIKSKNE